MSVRMLERVEGEDAPRDKIRDYVESLRRALERHPYLPRIMMREMAGEGIHLSEYVSEDFGKIFGFVAKIVEEGCASGDLDEGHPEMRIWTLSGSDGLQPQMICIFSDLARKGV